MTQLKKIVFVIFIGKRNVEVRIAYRVGLKVVFKLSITSFAHTAYNDGEQPLCWADILANSNRHPANIVPQPFEIIGPV